MPRTKHDVIQGVYRIINEINGKEYIGSSKDITIRMRHHLWELRCGRHTNPLLQRAYDKYGNENFKYEILEIVPKIENLISREQWWLDTLNPELNLSKVAGGFFMLGSHHTDETKRKIGIKTKQRMTDEFKSWLSDINKGNKYGLGKRKSDETKAKIGSKNRINLLGHKQSKETIDKRKITLQSMNIDRSKSTIDREHIAKGQREKAVTLRNTDGEIISFYNLFGFCSERNISYRQMWKLVKGYIKQYKGWKVLDNYA